MNIATGKNKAAEAPAPDPECSELDEMNMETRGALMGNTADRTVVGGKEKVSIDGSGTTVSSSKFKPGPGGGSAKVQSAHNNQKAQGFAPDLAEGSGGESQLCAKANHEHASPKAQKAGHAEARMLDDLFKEKKLRPGKMTFNIDWIPNTGEPSKMPCPACHKMLCAAKACGLRIFLCDKNNKKQELTDPKHCPIDEKNAKGKYMNLQATMDELPPKKGELKWR